VPQFVDHGHDVTATTTTPDKLELLRELGAEPVVVDGLDAAAVGEASRRQRDELAERFFAAVTDGDMDGLVELLADDVVVYGDGGGKGPSGLSRSSAPIVSPDC
jgi:NADPH:quinone reductase-like Zn-dependent oxidoreductase